MRIGVISRILGIMLMLFSITLVPPLLLSFWFHDGASDAFGFTLLLTFSMGLLVWAPVHRIRHDLRIRDGFVITAMFWLVLALFGALPFMISQAPNLSFTDAFFESLSGWTTTGATVITGIEFLPKSILFYRQQLQWLGGMGIIVLAVAILPMLGIGGMQLFRAETPGPVKDSKLTPRITETAKALWYLYLSLTIACTLGYWFVGMDMFDAICHAFATVAIGGFSTYDASIGHFDNSGIELVAIIFMLISSVNFGLHFFALRHRSLTHYLSDPEVKFLMGILPLAASLIIGALVYSGVYEPLEAIRYGVFELVSIATTTGFGTADFTLWPFFAPTLLFILSFIGGCAGSTGGGMKVIRVILIAKQGAREIRRLIHPNAIFQIKLGGVPVQDRVLEAVWGFFSIYILSYVVMMLLVLATGVDFTTAFSAVGACINNLGPGLADVSAHYGNLNDGAKWILSIAMLLGRLEIFTLLVLFTPVFWRN
jgi:trk system potassium uptake protein TrkH